MRRASKSLADRIPLRQSDIRHRRGLIKLAHAALARGLAQGEGGLIANQYNADAARALGAAGTLYNAGNTTAGTLSGLNQTALGNELQGAGLAGQIPALARCSFTQKQPSGGTSGAGSS
jgi:hypothetical protein